MIRRATPDDLPRIIEMGQRFIAETPYRDLISEADPERVTDLVVKVATSPDGVILIADDDGNVTGMIAMVVGEHPYSGERTGSELVWWVEPEHRGYGLRLLKAAEEWARDRGATRIHMVAPNDQIGALYARLGYTPAETTYMRSI